MSDLVGNPEDRFSGVAAQIEMKLRFFKSSKHINEKGDGPALEVDYLFYTLRLKDPDQLVTTVQLISDFVSL